MFGFQIWAVLAVILTIAVIGHAIFRMRTRGWVYRLLVVLGFLSLIWGLLPVLGGQKMSPYLVVGAIVAFGFLVLSESTGDGSRW